MQMQEINYLKRNKGSFQQLKSNNFVGYIPGPTNVTNNLTILEYIKFKSDHPTWQNVLPKYM